MGKRAIMREFGVGHATVQQALESAWSKPRKPLPPRPLDLDLFKPLIDEMLRADLTAPPKQRHTTKRIFDRLLDEHDAAGASYYTVRTYVVTDPLTAPTC
ncbi:hypothetical protein [Actinomadura sp. 6N118]|uniref:hypothetical protein n=1 Tax=Actinomadura sp. 6N118 TaxID=3375151 RepID=UPI00379F1D14